MTTGNTTALNPSQLRSSTSSSRSSSRSSSSSRPSLTLDLSNLPPLSHRPPPSNTLLITDLNDLHIFQPSSLMAIRSKINNIASLNSFSPLPSFRRIVCSFHSIDDAIRVRQTIEMPGNFLSLPKNNDDQHKSDFGSGSSNNIRTRIYFGEHTPIEGTDEEARQRKFLEAPHSQKLFFISPPPSPPAGWTMRNEGPPNKQVHATDLAEALAVLNTEHEAGQFQHTESDNTFISTLNPLTPLSASDDKDMTTAPAPILPLYNNNSNTAISGSDSSTGSVGRSRSSTLIYHPSDHGGCPSLPAVMVEDTSLERRRDEEYGNKDIEMRMDTDDSGSIGLDGRRKAFAPTARPPVELIQ